MMASNEQVARRLIRAEVREKQHESVLEGEVADYWGRLIGHVLDGLTGPAAEVAAGRIVDYITEE